ncbi:MAG: hypothetical protein QGG64_19010 [Candidatus Latescibacteria bacterium]|nr:hypothetical protein [Candidatus Latescibacterota bacterium]
MTFNQINRRFHLYLALTLLPWLLMYGISSIQLAHRGFLDGFYDDGTPPWTVLSDRPYNRPVPKGISDEALRLLCTQIVEDLEVEVTSRLGFHRPNTDRLLIYIYDFWTNYRVIYDIKNRQAKVERKRFRWDHFLGGLHARGGFEQDSFLNHLWAVMIDLVSAGFILWVASGLYMWWQLKQTRRWGVIAFVGGLVSFLALIVAL